MKIKREIIAASIFSLCTGIFGAGCASAATKDFVVSANGQILGDDISGLNVVLELQEISQSDNATISTKPMQSGKIDFDPIQLDDADSTSHFYRIIQKDTGVKGVTSDNKIVYVRIVPSRNLIAYQDDTSYKTVNDGSGAHPYHATDEELQGQAYAVFDSKTKTLTFFRDEEGKYANGYAERTIEDGETYYKQYFTDFELANKDHPRSSGAAFSPFGYGCGTNVEFRDPYFYRYCHTTAAETETIIFKDAIRPEGAINEWFYQFVNVVTADISKLDTSRVTSMNKFFDNAEKLENIDITTMDFRKASETAAETGEMSFYHMFNHATNALQELDFRNFDIVDMTGRRPLGEAFWGVGLRYLNTTNLSAGGASQDFNGNYCLERLVVGDKYSFYRSNLDAEKDNGRYVESAGWLKIETGEVNKAQNMIVYDHGAYLGDPNPNAAGNYVRPSCNLTPATFTTKYVKPASSDDDIKNPETNDDLTAANLAIVSIAGLFVVAVLSKTNH